MSLSHGVAVAGLFAAFLVAGFATSAGSAWAVEFGKEGVLENEEVVFSTQNTSSTDSTDVSLSVQNSIGITIPASVQLPIKPTAEGQFGKVALDVKVGTTNIAGYTLTMQANTDTLKREQQINGEDITINTLSKSYTCTDETSTTCDEFPVGYWGYKVGNSTMTYNSATPLTTKAATINTTEAAGNESTTTVYIGAKLDNSVPMGSYNGVELTFIATTNPVAYTINFVGGNDAAVADTTNKVSNVPGQQTGDLNADTDTEITLTSSTPSRTNYSFAGWCSVKPTTTNKVDACTGGTSYSSGGKITMNASTTNSTTLYAMWNIVKPTITVNFGTGVSSVTINGSTVSTSGGKITTLEAGQKYTISVSYATGYKAADTNPVTVSGGGSLSGYDYTAGTAAATITASATKRTDMSLTINFTSAQVNSVAVWTGANGTGTKVGTVSTSGNSVSGLTFATTYYMVPDIKSDYKFSSWSQNSAGTGGSGLASTSTEKAGFNVGVGTNSVTLATEANATYIQSLTLDACKVNVGTNGNAANVGDEIEVVDKRDNKTYKVRYINGYCWMTQNLRFLGNTGSASGKMTLDSTNSNGASGTIDLYSLNSSSQGNFGAYSEHCDSTNGYNYACVYDSGSESTGVWYNYFAATAGNIKTNSNTTNVAESGPSVCPNGWHLPSGPNTTSNSDFNKLVGNTTSGWQAATTGLTAFNAVSGGYYYGGSLNSEASGYWWSATQNDATGRYYLIYNSSNGQFSGVGSLFRYLGFFVRCVRTS